MITRLLIIEIENRALNELLHSQCSILNVSFRFPNANIEAPRAKCIEREADNSVDQAILFIQQRRRELDPVAWRYELVWP
jgi:hypothetical protein